ncbi:uncharacterized protein LOC125038850 [Penaeus chinensis]|uniref:uncharacterized protein LOC125038850 n=1 Tax=Penaeus chinensis TaxID=139456 RepID=UPI001FB5B0D1|nr:uncharacterized protein LOC125038850 [Penaeus chinensis]
MCGRGERSFSTEFIELYRAQPSLWNNKTHEYSDRNRRAVAYDILVKKLKEKDESANKDTVSKKINSLGSAFRKEFKKVQRLQKLGASSENVYQPTLWYFDLMMFLKDNEKETLSNIEEDLSVGLELGPSEEKPSDPETSTADKTNKILARKRLRNASARGASTGRHNQEALHGSRGR